MILFLYIFFKFSLFSSFFLFLLPNALCLFQISFSILFSDLKFYPISVLIVFSCSV